MVKRKFKSQLKLPTEDVIPLNQAPPRKRARSSSISGALGKHADEDVVEYKVTEEISKFPGIRGLPAPLEVSNDDSRLIKCMKSIRNRFLSSPYFCKLKSKQVFELNARSFEPKESESLAFVPPEWTFPGELGKSTKKKKKAEQLSVTASLQHAQKNAQIISEILEAGEVEVEEVDKEPEEKKDIEDEEALDDEDEENLFDEDDYTQSYYYEGDAGLDDDGAFGNDDD
jgi:hypothetical protein